MLGVAVGPGDRVAGRYRLGERYGGLVVPPSRRDTWWAYDEALRRTVWVRLVPAAPAGSGAGPAPGIPAVLVAARAAAALPDPRFLRIFDFGTESAESQPHRDAHITSTVGGTALHYLVTEAPRGMTLTDLLTGGALPAEPARTLTLAVADALASAHRHGLSHRRLSPDDIVCGENPANPANLANPANPADVGLPPLRIVGLELAAVADPAVHLPDARDDDPAGADADACGAVLYAALTGRWPGPGPSLLPPAPRHHGRPRSPRQVRAGVPAVLDAVVRQALDLPGRGSGPRLSTPAQVAAALQPSARAQLRQPRGRLANSWRVSAPTAAARLRLYS